MTCAPVNRIIPLSVVDGPGNRTAVFLQGCNIACAYCHNPETQHSCISCGECVGGCPSGALGIVDGKVSWDSARCIMCDRCIKTCPRNASPKVKQMSVDEVMDEIRRNVPFIRGITVSGGECMLHAGFVEELFRAARAEGLGTLIDSNGTVDFSRHTGLMSVTDGVMLDVKSWDEDAFRRLTGASGAMVKRNLRYLAETGRIEELRIVCLDGEVDAEAVIRGIAETIPGHFRDIPLKLIRFRPHGVRGRLEGHAAPNGGTMERYRETAIQNGFNKVIIR